MDAGFTSHAQDKTAYTLLKLIEKLVTELYANKPRTFVLTLDSSLDKDLGLDSLARVELIARIEQHFNVTLPQQVFVEAESPRDLLRSISSAQGQEELTTSINKVELVIGKVEELPHQASTLIDVLEWHVQHHPDRLHMHIVDDEGEAQTLSYKQLWQGAEKVAAGLQQHGLQLADTVAIMLPTGKDYFFSFYGILLTGAIPVPIYPPVRRSQLEDHLKRHSGILNNCVAKILVTMPEAKMVAKLLKSQVLSLREVVTVADLTSFSTSYVRPAINPNDVAFLQYTSGSTGNPKGVVLTHANLLANVRAMGKAVKATPNDVFVSWLPLYHDMGLIGAWFGSLYFAMALVVMSPLSFLTRPKRWLWAIHQYRGTLSASPNFGYELCLKRLQDEDIEGLDLSSWRLAFNGAEPVSPETIKRFTEHFQTVGFKAETMMPVYGLAESSVGLAFPSLPQKPIIDHIQRNEFSKTGQAIPANQDDKNALSFVASGHALSGHQIRIVNIDGKELPERHEGYLQFRGPSVTSGYYRNPEETKKLFIGDWLDSGDLAYIADGEIFITGRNKDIIIRAGRNVYPHELEEVVGNIDGIRNGCVAAFPAKDQASATERLVVLAETREMDQAIKEELKNQISSLSSDLIGLPPDEIILAPPHTVLKTSSGKVRRSACRELYEQNLLGQAPKAFWLQMTRTALRSMLPIGRRLQQRFINNLYVVYSWLLFTPIAGLSWLAIMLLPTLKWRWRAVHALARFLVFASGTKVVVNGLENLPPASQISVFVANHSSYLDSFAILASIPRDFSFVSKSEFSKNHFAGPPLKRLHAEFVERFDIQQGINDSKDIANARQRIQSLFFFPEGTFTRVSGLQKFHMGAFITAAKSNMQVVPIAIRGTRSILRSDTWLPRHGNITLTIGQALSPTVLAEGQTDNNWSVAVKLKETAHQHILRYCGEVDLSNESS